MRMHIAPFVATQEKRSDNALNYAWVERSTQALRMLLRAPTVCVYVQGIESGEIRYKKHTAYCICKA